MKAPRKILKVFVGVLLACLLVQLAFNPYFQPYFQPSYWSTLSKFGEALRIVHVSYVDGDQAELDQLSDNALAGMLQSLDKYSNYLPADAYDAYRKSSRMEFEGIGVEVQDLQDRITVVRVFEGGSAMETGVLPGDWFAEVDGEDVTGLSLRDTVDRVKGVPGTKVNVRLHRPWPEPAEKQFEVTRRSVRIPSVSKVQIFQDTIGYVRISRFTDDTHARLQKALDELRETGATALVLDLRGNPGGLLAASVEIASEFLEDDALVVSVRARGEETGETLRAMADGRAWTGPIAALMDRNSASASEILAGALKAYGLGKVVGEKSVGKGTVQTVYNLKAEAGMVLTTAKYYLPDGTTIAGTGVEPDVAVEVNEETYSQVRLSLLHRASMPAEQFEKTFGFAPMEDPQLNVAIEVLTKGGPAVSQAPAGESRP